jgi:hypothetical protein
MNTKEEQLEFDFEEILKQTEEREPSDSSNPIFRFEVPGDQFVGKFIGRRHGVKTKTGTANVLDVDIRASKLVNAESVIGPHSVFESSHITQLLDGALLRPGDIFVLRLHSVDKKSGFKQGFKKFYFEKITKHDDEVPLRWPDDNVPNFDPPPQR